MLSAWWKVSGRAVCLVSGRRIQRMADRRGAAAMRRGGRRGDIQVVELARNTAVIPPNRPMVLQNPRLVDLAVVGNSSQV